MGELLAREGKVGGRVGHVNTLHLPDHTQTTQHNTTGIQYVAMYNICLLNTGVIERKYDRGMHLKLNQNSRLLLSLQLNGENRLL